MSDTVSLPPSYQEPSSSGPNGNAHQELLVRGADEPGTIAFVDLPGGRTTSHRLARNESGGVDLVDVARAETIYTIQAEAGSKVFTATRLTDSADSSPATTSVKPEKISRAGGFIYKAAFPNPYLDGTRCVWKGSIFQSVELYAKDTAGQRTPIALYIRKPNGEHTLRLYPLSSPSASSSSSSSSNPPFPSLPLILSTLYPFLQLYWKYTRKTFTSDKKLSEWSATAQPSKWDSRILGKAQSGKGKEKGGAVPGNGRDAHPSSLPLDGNGEAAQGWEGGGAGAGHYDDADAKTLQTSSDEGGYDSDDDLKGGFSAGTGNGNGSGTGTGTGVGAGERQGTPTTATAGEESPGTATGRAGKSPSRLGKLFGRRGE